jgi:hypothetical protein
MPAIVTKDEGGKFCNSAIIPRKKDWEYVARSGLPGAQAKPL